MERDNILLLNCSHLNGNLFDCQVPHHQNIYLEENNTIFKIVLLHVSPQWTLYNICKGLRIFKVFNIAHDIKDRQFQKLF